MATYVYGIVESQAEPRGAAGIADAPLQLVPGDGNAALVSELPGSDLELGRDEILTHARVLEEAMSRGTVLPMRFGVVMESPDEVRQRLLAEHGSELARQLELLSDKVELNVRAVYEEEPLMREVMQRDPRIAELRDAIRGQPEEATYYDRIKLGELVAAAVDRQREVDAGQIVDALTPLALDVEVAELAHERVVVSASFLVERRRISEFDQAVDRVGQEQAGRIRFKYTGPLPPHSFVELAGAEA
jgi:hypothetical protein